MQYQEIDRVAADRRESAAGTIQAGRHPTPEEIDRTVAYAQRLRAEMIGDTLRNAFRRVAGLFGATPKPRHG